MPDLETVSLPINVTGNALAALTNFLGVFKSIGKELEKFDPSLTTAVAGLSLMAGGFYELSKASRPVLEVMAKMASHGGFWTAENVQRAYQMAAATGVVGTRIEKNLETLEKLTDIFQDLGRANDILPDVLRAQQLAGGKADVVSLVQAFGPRDTGEDNKALRTYLDYLVRTSQATGEQVSPAMMGKVFKRAGATGLEWTPEFTGGPLPQLAMDLMGGGDTGIQANLGNIGALLNTAMGEAFKSKSPRLEGIDPEAMRANPYAFAQILAEQFKKEGINTPAEVAKAVREVFIGKSLPNEMAVAAFADMVNRGRVFKGAESPFEERTAGMAGVLGNAPESLLTLYQHSPAKQLQELGTAISNLGTVIGKPLAELQLAATGPFVDFINNMSKFVATSDPQKVKVLEEVLLGLTGTFGAITALAAAITIGTAAGITGIFAGLTGLVLTLAALDPAAVVRLAEKPFTTGLVALVEALGRLSVMVFPGAISLIDKLAALGNLGTPYDASKQGAAPPGLGTADQGAAVPTPNSSYMWTPPPLTPNSSAMDRFNKWNPPPPQRSSMNYIPSGATLSPAALGASWAPPPAPKPVQVAMTLNLDGRTLAQALSTQIADLHEFATGAPSSNAYADYVGADNQISST